MPYINDKYSSRAQSGSGKFKIGEKVRFNYRNKRALGNYEKKINGKIGTVIADMFIGIYDYLVHIPEMGDYLAEEKDLMRENGFKKLCQKSSK